MDIWNWVYELQEQLHRDGHTSLAQLISDAPHYVVEGEHERAEALIGEGIAQATRLKLSWLQIFFRHWRLQSRVLHRLEVANNLDEAVALLEFAHREDNAQCPQSVCAVQDLANCYANKDGAGFAQIRVEVAREGLEKITPAWDCYDCIGTELIDAHLDAQDFDAALHWANQIKTERALQHKEPFCEFSVVHCKALLGCDQPQKALETSEHALEHECIASVRTRLQLVRSRALLATGQAQTAIEHLPDFDMVLETPTAYADWCEFTSRAVADKIWANDQELDSRLHALAHRLAQLGCVRDAFEIYAAQMDLALQRHIVSTATLARDAMQALLKELYQPLTAPSKLAELSQRLNSLEKRSHERSSSTLDLKRLLEGDKVDEPSLEALWGAAATQPDDAQLQTTLQHALSVRGWSSAALAIAKQQFRLQPNDDTALNRYGFALLDNGLDEELLQEYKQVSSRGEPSSTWHWLLAHLYFRARDFERCTQALDALLNLEPAARNAREMRADMRTKLEDFEGALADLDKVVELDSERSYLHWDRVTLATRLEHWTKAREIAATLGFKLMEVADPNTPIDEDWEYCEILCIDDNGDERLLSAERTGPVTARLLEIPPMRHPRNLHDIVIFDPAPLNPAPDDDDEESRRGHRWHYRYVQVQQIGKWDTYEIDGKRPPEEVVDALRKALRDLGCAFSIASSVDYCIDLSANNYEDNKPSQSAQELSDTETPAMYARVAIPEAVPAETVHQLLGEQLREIHPIVWTSLASAAGDENCVASHQALALQFNLDA